ncbi:MAG: hypothetical protein N4A49_08470 [Marinifilaceae bacterium]|jgi:hypothetical protein|nr:hypothetical protein [Marinifilaceae bacterium]
MPYRRLPNTDAARLRALKTALSKGQVTSDLAFQFSTYQKIQNFLPHFELAISNLKQSKKQLVNFNKDYSDKQRKAKLYVSHFLKVLNFAIQRKELLPKVREFYTLDKDSDKLPDLSEDENILQWGEKILKGESDRLRSGGNPIYSPSAALVRVNCEQFQSIFNQQDVLKSNLERFSKEVRSQRIKANDIILELWNQIEDCYKDLPEKERRNRCIEYGIVYVYRKTEKIIQNQIR